jgi:hypothetical protein
MAAGVLPKPGSKFGPCRAACKHRDCQQTKRDAFTVCRFCSQSIGYDVRFVRARLSGSLAHESCLESAVERNDARVGESSDQ